MVGNSAKGNGENEPEGENKQNLQYFNIKQKVRRELEAIRQE